MKLPSCKNTFKGHISCPFDTLTKNIDHDQSVFHLLLYIQISLKSWPASTATICVFPMLFQVFTLYYEIIHVTRKNVILEW